MKSNATPSRPATPAMWAGLWCGALVLLGLAVLAVEGGHSLFTGRSLLKRERPFVDLAELLGSARGGGGLTAFAGAGIFRVHPDPRVGVVLQRGDSELLGAPFTADRLGVRGRPGPPPPVDALRVVILGDSVAFGAGVADDECLASQLERVLTSMRGEDARPVACYTVAVPGWNTDNATSFLRDHLDEYRPDVVVYIPVENDLTDSYGVNEAGNRRVGFDPTSRDPLLVLNDEPRILFQYHMAERIVAGEVTARLSPWQIGVLALTADLTAESRRRFDACADRILRLRDSLRAVDASLALLFYAERSSSTGFVGFLRERLVLRDAGIEEIPALTEVDPSLTLGDDPHPNPICLHGLAVWVAQWLIERGWVDAGAGRPAPSVPAVMMERRAPSRSREEILAWADRRRGDRADRAQTRIDADTGLGINQVYGGLNPDGSIGTRLLAMLERGGDRLTVRLAPLAQPPVDGPLRIAVEVDGASVGEITVVEGEAETARTFPLAAAESSYLEVRLVPSTWTTRDLFGHDGATSCRLLSLESH